MTSVGRLFAIAAILLLTLGLLRWSRWENRWYSITIGNRGYGLTPDYLAFFVGALFAVLAAVYYWFPILVLRSLSAPSSQLCLWHFWLSALAAFGFLVLGPALDGWIAPQDAAVREATQMSARDRAAMAVLATANVSCLLFLVAQVVFEVSLVPSALGSSTRSAIP